MQMTNGTVVDTKTSEFIDMVGLGTGAVLGLAVEGEQAAWDELVRRFGGLVHHVARQYRLTPEQCDDVAQHCWLQLVQRSGSIRDPERCGDWLATVARHESLKLLAGGRRAVPVETTALEAHVGAEEPCDGEVLQAHLLDEVALALQELPERCQVFLAHFLSDAPPTYEQVARELGMKVNSVGQTRTRYLRRLREVLEDRGVSAADFTR